MAYSIIEELEKSNQLLSVKETASLFGVGRQKIYSMIEKKKIPAIVFGGHVKLDPKALIDWVRRQHPIFASMQSGHHDGHHAQNSPNLFKAIR